MPLAVAVIVSTAVVLVSPFMGLLQSFLRRSLSTRAYVLLFGVGLLAAVGVAVLTAFVRIRERRRQRFAMLAAALVCGGGYMWATSTPWPEVNAVERVHFVEYGLIAFLFYRVWRDAGDPTSVLLPLAAAFVVGTLDEWLQWFIPYRVGEAHDVFLNLASIACGLMCAAALRPPAAMVWRIPRSSARRLALLVSAGGLIFAAFVSQVHLGHTIEFGGVVRFKSHYTAEQLLVLQQDRAARWRTQPPLRIARLSREDQYLDEALWHVRRRNLAEPLEAWHENLILERFYTPVLDLPTYAAPDGARWPAAQRANVDAARPVHEGVFVSTAEAYPIVAWPRRWFWAVTLAVQPGLLMVAAGGWRRTLRTDR